MTGKYTNASPPKCSAYAQFLKSLRRNEADAIFWTLFFLTVVLLMVSSMMFTKAARTHTQQQKEHNCTTDTKKSKKTRKVCLAISLLCFLLALVSVVVEVFAAFNIEFCDGEDLMMLYWGFWSLLQLGSLIAIFGICLNQWYSLNDKEQPPWDMAMGGPIPVIASLGHAWHICAKGAWRDYKRKTECETGNENNETGAGSGDGDVAAAQKQEEQEKEKNKIAAVEDPESGKVSRTSTLRPPTPVARHVGYTLDNEPLFALPIDCLAPHFFAPDQTGHLRDVKTSSERST